MVDQVFHFVVLTFSPFVFLFQNAADKDNVGEIRYYPEQGFRHYFYPFRNQDNYLTPMVFVKFMNPPKNIALMIECRALAPNIHYDRQEKEGGIHFELLVDPWISSLILDLVKWGMSEALSGQKTPAYVKLLSRKPLTCMHLM